MARGTVRWFDDPQGAGLIALDAGGGDVFVLGASLVGPTSTLSAGDRVEFEVAGRGDTARAIDVRVPSRMERALGRALHDEVASSRGALEETEQEIAAGVPLGWEAFSARFYPGRCRHDLHAIVAYSTYRSSSRAATPEA